jgi:segregation and condensation protein A
MPSILTLETKKYAIKLDNFEGPLDLLCNLIEKNKMSIYDIKLDEITNQYIELINKAQELNLEVASEFLTLASTLLYIKSKKLLPSKQDEEEEISEDELIRRIIEYKKYKDVTEKLRKDFDENSTRFYKLPENIELPKQQLEEKYEENIIPELYKKIWEKNQNKVNENAKNIEKIAITDTYTVVSKVKEMFKELIKNKSFVFNKLFSIQKHNRQEVVTAFSGLLELSRRSKVETEQNELFGDINVKKRK